jgi:hypothetical protein
MLWAVQISAHSALHCLKAGAAGIVEILVLA